MAIGWRGDRYYGLAHVFDWAPRYVTVDQTVSPSGIASLEAFGSSVVAGPISCSSIVSTEAFGTAIVAGPITCIGISSAEAFGTLALSFSQYLSPDGIASLEAFGALELAVVPPLYKVSVDWNLDGDYGDAEEDISADVISIKVDRGMDQAWELGKGKATVCEILVDNVSRKYSPENSSSPVYGDVRIGRPVQVLLNLGGVDYPLFIGAIEDLRLDPSVGKRSFLLYAEDGSVRLRGDKVTTILYTDIKTGAAMGHILDAVGWPAGKRILDDGQTTLDYWWLWEKAALRGIRQLEETELGVFYIDAEGNAVFEDRHHKLKGAHLTSQATYGPADKIYRKFGYNRAARDVYNEATVTTKTYTLAGITVLWTIGDEPCLAPGEVRTWRAVFGTPATDLVTPAASTDYVGNSQSGGGGDDLTGDLSLTLTALSEGADVEVENTGSRYVYVTLLQQRGKALLTKSVTVEDSNAASQTNCGIRSYPLPAQLITSEAVGKDFCTFVVGHYGNEVPRVRLTVWNPTNADLVSLLGRQISDRITVKNPELGMDTEFFVRKLKHEITRQGKLHELTIEGDQAGSETYWVLGTSKLGEETKLAY